MNFTDLEKVPSPPGVAVKLLELFGNPDVSIDDLNHVIGVDPTLTAKIVKYVNSPMFARKNEVSSLRQAITILGANGVKLIALSFSLTDTGGSGGSDKFDFDQFWSSSLATAVCARSIYLASARDADSGFLVGLLLNVGQLAMYCSAPEKYEALLADKTANDPELIEIEARQFGANRYSIGSKVLAAWHFPQAIVQVLANFASRESWSPESQALDLANRMGYLFLGEHPDFETVRLVQANLSNLADFDATGTEELFNATMQDYGKIASVLSYDCPARKTLREIELEAKTRIVEMTMDLHLANAQVTRENLELKDLAYIDALTGLGNRRQYESIATAELSRCARTKRMFCLVMIDIDHFKVVNDTWGHMAGDAIIAGVASRLGSGLRSYDFVFRYGGEEFVLVLPETGVDDCQVVAERLRNSVESEPFGYEDLEIPVTISLGGAVFGDANLPLGLEELFRRADQALYVAKQSGRNRFVLDSEAEAIRPLPLDVPPGVPVEDPAGIGPAAS